MAQTIFGVETPVNLDNSDGDPYSLGTRFETLVDGQATHGRWYFSTTPATAPIQIAIYRDTDQQQLGSATFPGGMPPGWGQVAFDPPIDLVALVQYRVVVWTPNRYVSTGGYFGDGKTAGDIICPPIAGRFAVGPAMVFPDSNFGQANYWPDIVFQAAGEAVPAEGAATLGLDLAPAAAGGRRSAGSVALSLSLAPAVVGEAGGASGAAGVGLSLAVSAAGARPARGAVALSLNLAVVARAPDPPTGPGGGPRLVTSSRANVLASASRPAVINTSTWG